MTKRSVCIRLSLPVLLLCMMCVLCLCIDLIMHTGWGPKGFAVFCGLAMHSVMNYEKILKAHARQKVALEVLSFHASASTEETERLMVRNEEMGALFPVRL